MGRSCGKPLLEKFCSMVCEELQLVGRNHIGEDYGELSLMGDRTVSHVPPTLEQGEECEESPPLEEGVAETMCDEPTVTYISHPPGLLVGRR
ncbi:hypothetical protein BTVI_73277 [Pitangus sulphuratus]|nr:hypothetical protein BTVI_73277 [Pitangus sulphuratus]